MSERRRAARDMELVPTRSWRRFSTALSTAVESPRPRRLKNGSDRGRARQKGQNRAKPQQQKGTFAWNRCPGSQPFLDTRQVNGYDQLVNRKLKGGCIMLCPKCNREMSQGILGGRGYSFFLPDGETYPRLLSNKILEKKHAVLLPPDEFGSWDCDGWPVAFWCGECKRIIADYSHLMK